MTERERQRDLRPKPRWLDQRRRKFFIALSVIYLIVLLTLTHMHVPQKVESVKSYDKYIHFILFGGLTFCVLPVFRMNRVKSVVVNAYIFTFNVTMICAMVDETTQPFVGRNFDIFDLMSDAGGVITVLIAHFVYRKIFPKTGPPKARPRVLPSRTPRDEQRDTTPNKSLQP